MLLITSTRYMLDKKKTEVLAFIYCALVAFHYMRALKRRHADSAGKQVLQWQRIIVKQRYLGVAASTRYRRGRLTCVKLANTAAARLVSTLPLAAHKYLMTN